MNWDINRGEDTSVEAIKSKSHKGVDLMHDYINNATKKSMQFQELSREAKEKELYDNAIYIGMAHQLMAVFVKGMQDTSSAVATDENKMELFKSTIEMVWMYVFKQMVEGADEVMKG